jgi:hypothetical protein
MANSSRKSAGLFSIKQLSFTLIPEFSWWRTSDGKRLMCVIEKYGRHINDHYQVTELGIIERGIDEKKRVPYKLFTDQVSEGKLKRVFYSDVDVRHDLFCYGRTMYADGI